jgi:site-specific recombinase XerD
MKGMRPLQPVECERIRSELLKSFQPKRNIALFEVGISTGFRIKEILTVRLGDVIQGGNVVEELYIAKRHIKKQLQSRSILLQPTAQAAVLTWADELKKLGYETKSDFLFQSTKGANKAICESMAWGIIKNAATGAGLTGRIGTHSLRKTFAYNFLREGRGMGMNDIDILRALQKALGHRRLESTLSYVGYDEENINRVLNSMRERNTQQELLLI